MIKRSGLLIAVIGTLVLTSAAYADMISVSGLYAGDRQPLYVYGQTNLQETNSSGPLNNLTVAGSDLWSFEFLPETIADVSQTSEMQQPKILMDRTSSLSLCLYAMIGLGLCRTAPWMRKLSFGFVPDWYHNGGPFQIGHSYAVTPESLCPVPAFCFVQPVCMAEDSIPQYRLGTVVSLWRKSQFTPCVLVPRGPPNMS